MPHERQDLRAREPLGRCIVRHLVGAGARFFGARMVGDAEAVAALVLPVQYEPRAGGVACDQPRLVEERGLHRTGRVGHGRLDQRAHSTAANRPLADRADLDEHGRGLARRERDHRTSLAARARDVFEQIADAFEAQGAGRLGGLAAERERLFEQRGTR